MKKDRREELLVGGKQRGGIMALNEGWGIQEYMVGIGDAFKTKRQILFLRKKGEIFNFR